MISNFLIVGQQVLVLFILILIGFVCAKIKLFDENCTHGMTEIILYIVTPCVIINSFNREFDKKMLQGLFITFCIAICVHILTILIVRFTIFDKDKRRECTLRFAGVFSNCGFMSLPLQQALLGEDGVFFGSVYVAVFNLIVWSYGYSTMSGVRGINIKKLFLNPGIIGLLAGSVLFLSPFSLPGVASSPVSFLAALNTPLPMIIIGYHLAGAKIGKALKDTKCIYTMVIRLLIVPIITFLVLYVIKIVPSTVFTSCIICAAAPVAATTTMFSLKFNRDTELSVGIVSLSTLFSLITMPLIVGFTEYFLQM